MLVLTRCKNERINIEDSAGNVIGTVLVSDIRGGRVKLGFEFPQEFRIRREDKELAPAA